MKDNFKKVIGLIGLLMICLHSSAQEDSTDLNFYSVEPVLETEQDSAMHLGLNFGSLQLEFELTDTSTYKIWVELQRESSFFGVESLLLEDYTLEELELTEMYDNGVVQIPLGILNLEQNYLVNVRLENEIGMLLISLTKPLEQ